MSGMDERTLAALQGSIAKWEKIVAGTGADMRDENCPLCALFNTGEDCLGCPVAEKVGRNWGTGTPYMAWGKRA